MARHVVRLLQLKWVILEAICALLSEILIVCQAQGSTRGTETQPALYLTVSGDPICLQANPGKGWQGSHTGRGNRTAYKRSKAAFNLLVHSIHLSRPLSQGERLVNDRRRSITSRKSWYYVCSLQRDVARGKVSKTISFSSCLWRHLQSAQSLLYLKGNIGVISTQYRINLKAISTHLKSNSKFPIVRHIPSWPLGFRTKSLCLLHTTTTHCPSSSFFKLTKHCLGL